MSREDEAVWVRLTALEHDVLRALLSDDGISEDELPATERAALTRARRKVLTAEPY